MHCRAIQGSVCNDWVKSSVIREVFGEGYAPVPKRKGMGFRLSKKGKKKQNPRLSSLRKVYVKQEGLKAITVIHGRTPCATKATYVERPS